MNRRELLLLLLLASVALLLLASLDAHAAQPQPATGSGLSICAAPIAPTVLNNPTLITNCSQAGIQAALDGGGEIAFACGAAPVTIGLTSPLRVTAKRTVIDGGGLVTLDGQNQTKILENPFIAGHPKSESQTSSCQR